MDRHTSETAAVQIARLIEDEIVAKGRGAGYFIGRRQELASRYSVAPATLGEAIQLLRSRGLVDAKPGPGGGIFVADASPFTGLIDELLSIRESPVTLNDSLRVLDALDGAILHDAIEHASTQDIRELRLRALALQDSWGEPAREREIWALHARIAQISPNELLRSLYLNLVGFITRRYSEENTAPATPFRLQTHLDFVTAIERGDHELGDEAILRHTKESLHGAAGANH
ncbi:FadR/GntR family transcriptional regulator [Specibacter cremeus]|uniref:FadR/GntR family transcriptional regulator n=1 Tax=Specibacter cremeus TaxID=1629051 RepID=UPI000F774AE6|nr:FCD domain-containing protein [Specibacter cremeus]